MKPSVIISDKEILGGTPVFRGTRVPAEYLFEHLEFGKSLEDFLERYPTVTRKQAVEAIQMAEELVLSISRKHENPS
ncbi:MAG TPA: DUF433 domain-containing protein [Bacteroidia bacterium]|nr:DUF433 domain-containing protein [Bacteroidia bacterium]